MSQIKRPEKKKIWTVKVKFNFEGIKHEARMDLFSVYANKKIAFTDFFQGALAKAISDRIRGER